MAMEDIEDEIKNEKNPKPLDEDDIALLKTYGLGPYSSSITEAEKLVKDMAKRINDLCGSKESDTGLAAPSQWDLVSDKQMIDARRAATSVKKSIIDTLTMTTEDIEEKIKNEKNPRPLDEDDIALLKTYGLGHYSASIKEAEKRVKDMAKRINDLCGSKESDTGLAGPSQWDLVSDKQMMQEEQPLQVARCTKIINPNTEDQSTL